MTTRRPTAPPIPDEVVEAATYAVLDHNCDLADRDPGEQVWADAREDVRIALTVAFPHLVTAVLDSEQGRAELARRARRALIDAATTGAVVHVHHHDIERHAESFSEGYEAAVAQGLADDPTLAQDWLNERDAKIKAAAWAEGYAAGCIDGGYRETGQGDALTLNPHIGAPPPEPPPLGSCAPDSGCTCGGAA